MKNPQRSRPPRHPLSRRVHGDEDNANNRGAPRPSIAANDSASVADGRQPERRKMTQTIRAKSTYNAWQVVVGEEAPDWARKIIAGQSQTQPATDFPEPPHLVVRTPTGVHKVYNGQWLLHDPATDRYWSVDAADYARSYDEIP